MKLTVLGAEGTRRIDAAARKILEQTGVVIPHAEMLARFAKAGARVDESAQRVRIPSALIDDCLLSAGKKFTLYGRDHARRAEFGTGKRNYNTTAGQALWIDESGARRFPCLDDVSVAARIGDVLPEITIVGAMAEPHEIPVAYRSIEVAAKLLAATTKPVMFWFHDRASAAYIVELLDIVTEGRTRDFPPVYPFLEPISPLRFPRNGIDLLFETCKIPLPVPIGPMAQVGMSAPATLAGTLALETAEILAGICVTQLVREGTPVCLGGIPHAFDMRTTQIIFSGPEQSLMAVAMAELGAHYGLPVYLNLGLTDAKTPDAQAGLEIGTSLLMGALSGANIFGHLGIAGADQGASLEMLVLQHEAIEYVERIMRSFEINDETLAIDLIDRIGPGGNFIAEEHTVEHFRKEMWMPHILDRLFWSDWEERGRPDARIRAQERLKELEKSYVPVPFPDDKARSVRELVAKARKNLV